MIVNEFTQIAERVTERYLSVIFGLRGAYAKAFSYVDPTTPKAVSEFKSAAYQIASVYLGDETDMISIATEEIALKAATDALAKLSVTTPANEVVDALSDHLGASGDYLKNEIAVQLERDIATVTRKLQGIGLQAHLMARSAGITKKAAMVQMRLTDAGDFKFYFVDRQNRKWSSQKYVRTIWRKHLLSVYNETYLFVLSEYGQTKFQIDHTDASNKFDGNVYDIVDYPTVSDEIFHPNANAVVTAVQEV